MSKDIPLGMRFSHVYLDRGASTMDSLKMRRRISELVQSKVGTSRVADALRAELGIPVQSHKINEFFISAEINDFLDGITITYWRTINAIREGAVYYENNFPENFIGVVKRIFSEENVGYTVDNKCGVHFVVDEEFKRVRVSAVRGLGHSRYAAVRVAFEGVHQAFDQHPPDGKSAMRQTFEALEILFSLICDRAPRLGATEINVHLKPLIDRTYAKDVTAQRAAQKLLNSFSDWVDGAHFYRHGQGTEEPTQPPLEIAIMAVSAGTSFLRWLTDIDQAAQQAGQEPR